MGCFVIILHGLGGLTDMFYTCEVSIELLNVLRKERRTFLSNRRCPKILGFTIVSFGGLSGILNCTREAETINILTDCFTKQETKHYLMDFRIRPSDFVYGNTCRCVLTRPQKLYIYKTNLL